MLTFIKPGFFTSVQDLGRRNYRNKGIPTAGCMDDFSAQIANALVNNQPEDALLEITQIGPHMQFDQPTVVAFTGAKAELKLNGQKIEMNKAYAVPAGSEIKVGYCQQGIRVYMAIKGGIQSPIVYGSRSWYKGLTDQERCVAHDVLEYKPHQNFLDKYGSLVVNANLFDEIVGVEEGPEFYLLNEAQKQQIFNTTFKISNLNNRMGYQLEEIVENDFPQILSGPVIPGTVQLTPAGKLIVLMKDAATSGGYPRILQLTELGIAKIAQKSARDVLHFQMKS